MSKVIKADLVPHPLFRNEQDHWKTAENVVYRRGTMNTVLGFVGPDGQARRETGGDKYPGPYAYIVPLATVIAAYSTGPAPKVVELEPGDVVDFNGHMMTLVDGEGMREPRFV